MLNEAFLIIYSHYSSAEEILVGCTFFICFFILETFTFAEQYLQFSIAVFLAGIVGFTS